MKSFVFAVTILCLALGSTSTLLANCADDAIDTCNAKHPDPDKSDQAGQLYELCIKAQLGQKCPNSAAQNKDIVAKVQKARKGVAPKCPAGHTLRVDYKGKADWCVKSTVMKVKSTSTSTERTRNR